MSGSKGVFFTVDGVLGAALILLFLLLVPRAFVSETPTASASYLAFDAVNVLATLRVSELNTSRVQALIASGIITEPNQSVLEQIGEFWAVDDIDDAQNLSRTVLSGLLDPYSLLVDGDQIDGATENGGQLAASRRMVSGITKGRARAGFNARAIASKITKTTTDIFRAHPQGSAHEGGNGMDITQKVYLNATNITKATLYISIKYGVSDLNSMKFTVNGVDLGISHDDWLYDESSNLTSATQIAFTIVDVTDKIALGTNTIVYSLKSQTSGHARLNPGTRLEVTHDASDFHEVSPTINERTYFNSIASHETGQKRSGAWATMPINVPPGAIVTNATLHIRGTDIESYTPAEVVSRGKGDCSTITSGNAPNIRVYLNNISVFTDNGSALPSEVFDNTIDLTSLVGSNTNVVSVYLNMYADCFWGDGDTVLYSDPIANPSTSSYVDLTYTRTPLDEEYGKIDVVVTERLNTTRSNSVTYVKTLNSTILHSFIELATLETVALTTGVNGQQIFATPRLYSTPGALFVDNSHITSPGTNTFTLQDCIGCSILPESSYTFETLVPNQVGYGSTFDNESDARADATQRLIAVLGSAVDAVQIDNETLSIGDVPSLWGPALVEVRTWR